ncbi:hypothetical protein PL321_18315 [Caloramator sp. mosi_1]|uniref:hypothetical protein n=1 Tax=Caloramator sp. mosi_1 TaxID=3023090 RepID=UPI002362559D|nr:hypothetical protein [Caloramator sp. mosi_1]WDC84178.1 hypothetical protein PL321_18315 [Caloramator sp. mosi_1]
MNAEGMEENIDLRKEALRVALSLPSNMYTVEFKEEENTYVFQVKDMVTVLE